MSKETKAGVFGRGVAGFAMRALVLELEERSADYLLSAEVSRVTGHQGAVPTRECCDAWIGCLTKIKAQLDRMAEVSAEELHAMAEAKSAGVQ